MKEPKEQERKSVCQYCPKMNENEPDKIISQTKKEEHIYPRVPSNKRRGEEGMKQANNARHRRMKEIPPQLAIS